MSWFNSNEQEEESVSNMKELKRNLMDTLDSLDEELEGTNTSIQEKTDERDAVVEEIASLRKSAAKTQSEISKVEKSLAIISGRRV